MTPEGWTELMARVQKPPVIECPTTACQQKAKPHCKIPTCLWFVCEVCERTTWISPKFGVGITGKKIVQWSVRRSVRLPHIALP